MTDPMERAREVLDGDEGVPGIRPAVTYADHSYPAYSRQQMLDFAVKIAAEQRAAGRKEALMEAAQLAQDWSPEITGDVIADHRPVDGEEACVGIATAIRALGDKA